MVRNIIKSYDDFIATLKLMDKRGFVYLDLA